MHPQNYSLKVEGRWLRRPRDEHVPVCNNTIRGTRCILVSQHESLLKSAFPKICKFIDQISIPLSKQGHSKCPAFLNKNMRISSFLHINPSIHSIFPYPKTLALNILFRLQALRTIELPLQNVLCISFKKQLVPCIPKHSKNDTSHILSSLHSSPQFINSPTHALRLHHNSHHHVRINQHIEINIISISGQVMLINSLSSFQCIPFGYGVRPSSSPSPSSS